MHRQDGTGLDGLIGGSLIGPALLGWFLLPGLLKAIPCPLFGAGAGGMVYPTFANLAPEAKQRQYQQSAALATGAGLTVIFVLSSLV
jgi:ZIP family zinc transporter